MGFSISWAGVKGIDHAATLGRLNLKDNGAPDEYHETPFSGAASGEWSVIWSNDFDYFRDEARLASLSRQATVIACCIEEHVMYFTTEEWRDGRCIWRITHDAQEGNDHIVVEGAAPPSHIALLAEMRREQEGVSDVDYISEVPVRIAREITGFRYDQDSGYDFAELVAIEDVGKPKTKGWFGR